MNRRSIAHLPMAASLVTSVAVYAASPAPGTVSATTALRSNSGSARVRRVPLYRDQAHAAVLDRNVAKENR